MGGRSGDRGERRVPDQLPVFGVPRYFCVAMPRFGRQDPVTTGSYLASGLSGSNSATSLQDSTRARCPLEPVEQNGSRPWPGTLGNGKLPFAMRLRYYCLNGSYAAEPAGEGS